MDHPPAARRHRVRSAWRVAVLCSALGLAAPTPPAAAACPALYPSLLGWVRLDVEQVRLFLGVSNLSTSAETPAINLLDPSAFSPPVTFAPGFTVPLSIDVDVALVPRVVWFLGCELLVVDLAALPEAQQWPTSAGPPGPAGPAGAPGPAGPPGPPGSAGVHPSPLVYTFPRSGELTISDSSVTSESVILLQYVGGRTAARELIVLAVGPGQFTAKGSPGHRFRYVVFD
jgi:hypothetical protein